MVPRKSILVSAAITSMALTALISLGGCATTEGTDKTFDVPQPNYGQTPPPQEKSVRPILKNPTNNTSESTDTASASSHRPPPSLSAEPTLMRHNLRQIVEYDTYKMSKLVDREINLKDEDNDNYLSQVATTLGQTVMLQPHFTEREGALKELKGKIDQDDYVLVIERAANDLLTIIHNSTSPSDQAGAFVALTNLVTEVRTLKRPELREVLQKIADANLVVSDQARQYAKDPMEKIVSPSDEAQVALKKL